jgi:hypothetical protein
MIDNLLDANKTWKHALHVLIFKQLFSHDSSVDYFKEDFFFERRHENYCHVHGLI